MRLLLDTHAFLWFILGSRKLTARTRSLIEDPHNEKFISLASIWEMAIKSSLGKLDLARPFSDLIPAQIRSNGFKVLAIDMAHLIQVASLPFQHRDPFDRLLIEQSQVEGIPILSADAEFDLYTVVRLW